MDVGMTKSEREKAIHFLTGSFVVLIGFSAMMFAVRSIIFGS